MAHNFYVYEHWRLDKDECFYVGKGQRRRAYSLANRNRHWKNIVEKLERAGLSYEVRIVRDGLTEEQALALEIERIAFWDERGTLSNITRGGEGTSGLVHSEETREKLRAAHKRRAPMSDDTRDKISAALCGKRRPPFSVEHRAKLAARKIGHEPWNKGVPMSEDTRRKVSAAKKGSAGPWLGKTRSQETRDKISATKRAQFLLRGAV